jgi:hypothetical protein
MIKFMPSWAFSDCASFYIQKKWNFIREQLAASDKTTMYYDHPPDPFLRPVSGHSQQL